MLDDFLDTFRPVLGNEVYDYRRIRRQIDADKTEVILHPSVFPDFLPMRSLTYGKAAELIPSGRSVHLYIVPIGIPGEGHSGADAYFEILENFYLTDELPPYLQSLTCGMEIELIETILLFSPEIRGNRTVPAVGPVNAAYISLSVGNGRTTHILMCLDSPEAVMDLLLQYGIGMNFLVDSHKGLGMPLTDSPLYRKILNSPSQSLLPKYLLLGKYAFAELPDDFDLILTDRIEDDPVPVYLTPTGQSIPEYRNTAFSIRDRHNTAVLDFRRNSETVARFLDHPTDDVPLDAVRAVSAWLKERIKEDNSVHDFTDFEKHPGYLGVYRPHEERLRLRSELFRVTALLYLFETDSASRREALEYLRNMVRYHTKRVEMHRLYRDAYVFSASEKELMLFAEAIADDVKLLSRYSEFARFIGDGEQNLLEEALLRCAYKREDKQFADWLIDNEFYGAMQPELFFIIFDHDSEKAAEIASVLSPCCIEWIAMAELIRFERYAKNPRRRRLDPDIPKPLRIIFENISRTKAESVGSRFRSGHYRELYREMIKRFYDSAAPSEGTD